MTFLSIYAVILVKIAVAALLIYALILGVKILRWFVRKNHITWRD